MRKMSVLTVCGLVALACGGGPKDAPDETGTDADDTGGDNGGDNGGDSGGDNGGDNGGDSEPDYQWEAVLIDFDDHDDSMDVTDRYAEWVTFEVDGREALHSWNYPTYSRSEPMSAYTTTSPGGPGVSVDLTFAFTRPVRALEFWTLGDQVNGPLAVVEIETEDGTVDTVDLRGDGGATSAERCDLTAYEHVTRISIVEMEDPYTVNLDDISFEIRDR